LEHRHLIEAMGQARLAGRPLPESVYASMPPDHAGAYALQDELAVWLGQNGLGSVAGYKAGSTNDAAQAALGVDGPILGRVMSGRRFASGDRVARGDCPVGIECELAFRVAIDVPPRATLWTVEDAGTVLGDAYPAIEVIENRYGKPPERPATAIIADDIFQKGFVLGTGTDGWRDIALDAIAARVMIGGEEVATGSSAGVLGNPLASVAFVLNTLSQRDIALRPGDILMTGTMTPPQFPSVFPADVDITLDGIGTCSLTLE